MVGGTGQIAAQIQFDTPSRLQDVTPVAKVLEEYDIVVVPADSPHETMGDLVEAWQQDPSGTPWTGGGSFDQLVMTEIALVSDIAPSETTYIPSDGGGEAIQALLNGTAVAAAGGFADMYPRSSPAGCGCSGWPPRSASTGSMTSRPWPRRATT